MTNIETGKYSEISDVEAAIRELSIIFQALPSVPPNAQRDLIKFLHVAESKSPGEILKYKKQYDFGSYHKIIKEYDEYLDRLSKPGSQKVSGKSSADKTPQQIELSKPEPMNIKENHEIAKKNLQIQELQNRLSKVAGEKLMDGNPNITDLSDVNRPTKLAEQFRELYDNEWTCAYEELQKSSGMKAEEEIVKKLGKILKLCYEFCVRQARDHRHKIRETLVYPTGVQATINANVEPNIEEILKPKVRQIQRDTGVYAIPAIQEIFRMEHERDFKRNEWDESKGISKYITRCVQICWLFAIQNPPMKLNWPKEETTLDDHLVEFTKRGTHIKFVVWPTLYLHDKGPLMTKGVVQPF